MMFFKFNLSTRSFALRKDSSLLSTNITFRLGTRYAITIPKCPLPQQKSTTVSPSFATFYTT